MSDGMVRIRPLMGTFVKITIYGADMDSAMEKIDRIFDKLSKLEEVFSYFLEKSELNAINSNQFVKPSRLMYRLLRITSYFSKISNGVFDVTKHRSLSEKSSYKDIVFDRTMVRLLNESKIDFGGVAKGFVIDVAVRFARSMGLKDFTIDAGGDIYFAGHKERSVYIKNPLNYNELIEMKGMYNCAVASSCTTEEAIKSGGMSFISSKDEAVNKHATVIAKNCVTADALTKICLIDPKIAENLLYKFKAKGFVS